MEEKQNLVPFENDEGLWGFFDGNGKLVIPPQFYEVERI